MPTRDGCTHAVELATLTIDEATGLPFAKIYKPHEIDAGASPRISLTLPISLALPRFRRSVWLLAIRECALTRVSRAVCDSAREGGVGEEARGRGDAGYPLRRVRVRHEQ